MALPQIGAWRKNSHHFISIVHRFRVDRFAIGFALSIKFRFFNWHYRRADAASNPQSAAMPDVMRQLAFDNRRCFKFDVRITLVLLFFYFLNSLIIASTFYTSCHFLWLLWPDRRKCLLRNNFKFQNFGLRLLRTQLVVVAMGSYKIANPTLFGCQGF